MGKACCICSVFLSPGYEISSIAEEYSFHTFFSSLHWTLLLLSCTVFFCTLWSCQAVIYWTWSHVCLKIKMTENCLGLSSFPVHIPPEVQFRILSMGKLGYFPWRKTSRYRVVPPVLSIPSVFTRHTTMNYKHPHPTPLWFADASVTFITEVEQWWNSRNTSCRSLETVTG